MPFVDLSNDYLPLDRERLKVAVFDGLAERFPGWEPAPGNLETVLVEQLAGIGADLADVAVDVPPEIFRGFGTKIVGVAPQLAASATVDTTWTMVDDAGYTIPAGLPVQINATGSEGIGFFVQQEVLVAPGDTATAEGEVTLIAAVPGSAPTGLEDLPVVMIDDLAFVASIEMASVVSGGADEEDPSAYLDRLSDEMKLLAPRPILPADFAILAQSVSGVWRATAIDGYDPDDSSFGNARTVAVAALDVDGVGVGSGTRTAIEALLEGEREINFIVNVIEPEITQIKVTTAVVCLPGFDPDSVEDSVTAALTNYLSARYWGIDSTDARAWRNVTTVRRLELTSLVDRVPGVDYVSTLTLAKQPDSLGTADVTLDGAAALPAPGTISVSAT